jgi:hypothetical protein
MLWYIYAIALVTVTSLQIGLAWLWTTGGEQPRFNRFMKVLFAVTAVLLMIALLNLPITVH